MKLWKRGTLAAMLSAVLLLCAAVPAFGTSSTVYLMAVNDTVMETTAENVPAMVDGMLYVPYTMLSSRISGIDLKVSAVYIATRRTLLVSSGQKGVMFDTQTNTAQDLQGGSLPVRAVVRNSMVFVPIDWVCEYFGTISCSRVRTRYGTLVRVTNSAAILSDVEFVDAGDSLLADSLRRYLSTVENGGGTGVSPSSQPQESSAPSQAELYLAFRWGGQAEEIAQLLEARGERALFFFTPGELWEQDDLVRRLVGAGHTVGLSLEGESGPDCLAQAEEGRLLMASIAWCSALVVRADGLDRDGWQELTQAGFVRWSATSRGEDYSTGAALVEELDPKRMNYVELSCGERSAAFLRGALSAMDEEACRIRQATAPALA